MTSSAGPRPVLRRERVDGQLADAELGGVAQPRLDDVGARLVALDDGQAAGLRPAAVAVGDDGDVPRAAVVLTGVGHTSRISASLPFSSPSSSAICAVGELLQLDLGAVLVVGAGLAGVLELAQVVHDVAADVADRDPALLRDVADDLDELAAALLVELGHAEADELAVVVRRQADVGLHDRLLDRLDRARVVGLHGEQARLGRVDRRELLERRRRAVVVDDDAVEQRRAGAAGPHRAELVVASTGRTSPCAPWRPPGARLSSRSCQVLTSVPTRSPHTIRSMLRSSSMLKT